MSRRCCCDDTPPPPSSCCIQVTFSANTCVGTGPYTLAWDSLEKWVCTVYNQIVGLWGEEITVEKTTSGGDYLITVTLDGNTWQKNYGTTEPTPCELSEESIPHVSGPCTPSCTITAVGLTGCPDCTVDHPCLACIDDTPLDIEVVLSDILDGPYCGPAPNLSGGDLTPCSSLDGTYILSQSQDNPCQWIVDYPGAGAVCYTPYQQEQGVYMEANFVDWPKDPAFPAIPRYRMLLELRAGDGIDLYWGEIYSGAQDCSGITGAILTKFNWERPPTHCIGPGTVTLSM